MATPNKYRKDQVGTGKGMRKHNMHKNKASYNNMMLFV